MALATISATVDGATVTWRDRKRYYWTLALVVPLLPFLAWLGAAGTGLDVFWYTGPFWILVGIPIIDTLVGTDRGNPPPWADTALENDRYYRVLTYCYLPLQYAGFFWGAWMIAQGQPLPGGGDRADPDGGGGGRHRHRQRPRARPQDGLLRAVGGPAGARPDRLRPLPGGAQPRAPRAGGHPRGPGERPDG